MYGFIVHKSFSSPTGRHSLHSQINSAFWGVEPDVIATHVSLFKLGWACEMGRGSERVTPQPSSHNGLCDGLTEHSTDHATELVAENAALRAKVAALEYKLDVTERTMTDFHASIFAIIATVSNVLMRKKLRTPHNQPPAKAVRVAHARVV